MPRKTFVCAVAALLSILAASAASAQGQPQFTPPFVHPLKDDTGDRIANLDLPPALGVKLKALAGQTPVGNPQGDVTVYQFYDLNCPFCREAAADVDMLVRGDKNLKLIFVPYAILSVPSVQGAMAEVAVSKLLTPDKYLDFHKRIYQSRGTIDGPKVLAAAKDFGLDPNKVAADANTEATLNVLRATVDFGGEAQMMATPAYVIGSVVVLGHPGLKPLQGWIANARKCGKPAC